jgi:hypothetical protein
LKPTGNKPKKLFVQNDPEAEKWEFDYEKPFVAGKDAVLAELKLFGFDVASDPKPSTDAPAAADSK